MAFSFGAAAAKPSKIEKLQATLQASVDKLQRTKALHDKQLAAAAAAKSKLEAEEAEQEKKDEQLAAAKPLGFQVNPSTLLKPRCTNCGQGRQASDCERGCCNPVCCAARARKIRHAPPCTLEGHKSEPAYSKAAQQASAAC